MKIYTFTYSQDYFPSMPVIDFHLSSPSRSEFVVELSGLVDSGSDGTLIPINYLEQIKARQVGPGFIRGLMGERYPVDIHLVNLKIGPQTIPAVRAVAAPENSEIILGRNVLNQIVLTLNGPASTVEFSYD